MNEKQRLQQLEEVTSELLQRQDRMNEDIQKLRTTQLRHVEITTQHSDQLQFLFEELEAIGENVQAIDGKVQAIDGKVQAIDGKVGAVDGKVEDLAEKISRNDGNMDTLLKVVTEIQKDLRELKNSTKKS